VGKRRYQRDYRRCKSSVRTNAILYYYLLLLICRLDVPYLSVPEALRYILSWQVNDSQAVFSDDIPTEGITNLVVELTDIVRSKINEGKKLKKGEEVGPIDLEGLDLSPQFCKTFSPNLLRKCLAVTIAKSFQYARIGYILDVFSYGIVSTPDELTEMLGESPNLIVEIQVSFHILFSRNFVDYYLNHVIG
jgi:hypothetical protein